MKKKILIFGNKPVVKKDLFNEYVLHNFDYIIRVNRFNNIKETGEKTDILYLNLCNGWVKLLDEESKKYLKDIKKFYVNINNSRNLIPKLSEVIRSTGNYNFSIKSMPWLPFRFPEEYCFWEPSREERTTPTTAIVLISNIIKRYKDEYDIYFTCVDFYDREELLKNNFPWKNTWHKNVGKYEKEFLEDMVNKGYLHFLDHDKF